MGMTLTADDLARCEAVSRALLSPLSAPSIDDWRREVNRAFRNLLGVDQTLFAIPRADGLDFFTEDMESGTVARFNAYMEDVQPGRLRSHDPALDRWFLRRRQLNIGIHDAPLMDRVTDQAYTRSAFFKDVTIDGRMFHHMGFMMDLPMGEALICLAYDDPAPPPFGEDGMKLLQALYPAFQAGVSTLNRLEAQRTALAATLDTLEDAILVCDMHGAEIYRNRALLTLLRADPEEARLLAEMRYVARQLGPQAGFPSSFGLPLSSSFAQRETHTQTARYRLRTSFVPPAIITVEGAILVMLEPVKPGAVATLPTPDELRQRYGLTKREAEVALLLAEGLSNDELADRLFISPHTARRHTERVLDKLELTSRKALAYKLLQEQQAAAA